MKHFNSLEQRMIASRLDTLPPFSPAPEFSHDAQSQLHSFVQSFYHLLMSDPGLLFPSLHDDDAFNNRFNKSSDHKPDLLKYMQKASQEIDKFFDFLLGLGTALAKTVGAPRFRVPSKYRQLLSRLGLEILVDDQGVQLSARDHRLLAQALAWMATKPHNSRFNFSRCLFAPEQSMLSGNYRALSGSGPDYDRLLGYLENSGYHLLRTPDSPSWEYLKGKNGAPPERGGFQYKVNHIGISMSYDELVKEPVSFSVCIPSMAKLLAFFEEMDDSLKQFLLMVTKHCDNCRYCVQTDKTGTRRLAFNAVVYQEKRHALCPYFPGYRFTFDHLDESIVQNMIGLLSFMDDHLDFLVK